MLNQIFQREDALRAIATLSKVAQCGLEGAALTGGVAVEVHLMMRGREFGLRALHDIDFVVDRFEDVPAAMGRIFLARHVHPHARRGKTVVQVVNPEVAVRVDFFRAYEGSMERTGWVELEMGRVRLIGFEDLLARMTVLALDLERGMKVAPKFVASMDRLAGVAEFGHMQGAWADERREGHPMEFRDALERAREFAAMWPELLVAPVYSKDVTRRCEWCEATAEFPLCDASAMMELVGYC